VLTISTIPEALTELEKHTGRAWTGSELLDVATTYNLKLHAAAPIAAQTTIQAVVKGRLEEKFRLRPGHAHLAVLFPKQVEQLSIVGETTTMHPLTSGMEREGEYHWFTEPVRVTREQVRIRAETLWKILALWDEAQSGPWIDDETVPGGKRRHRGPDWMFPTITQPPTIPGAPAATRQAPTETQASTPNGSADSDDWKGKARVIADECFDHDTKATPPVRDSLAVKNNRGEIVGGYSFRVMGLMQERGIKGARGIITNPATIMREALQGKKWWANKQK
jgi:hypothetical protein